MDKGRTGAAGKATAANAIRFLAVDAIVRATEGHQGVPLGMAEIATALYLNHLKHDASTPDWWDRDRVVLSNGHGSMLLYSLLYLSGYPNMTLDALRSFREMGSHCAGHPERDIQTGIEVTTGPLGQGIANALGMAVAEAHLRARFGADLVNHYTYAFVGDGCLQEGVGQEMIALAGHWQLSRLILLWDDNQITDDGSTALSISEDVAERFRAAKWLVLEVDGHDIDAVCGALEQARASSRPTLIACRTVIARGIERLEGKRGGHSARLYPDDAKVMRERFQWPHAPFEVPADVLANWRSSGAKGAHERKQWQHRVDALTPAARAEFERVKRGELPAQLMNALEAIKAPLAAAKACGGINLSAAISDYLTDLLPERMVACADLEAPTDHKRRLAAFTATDRSGAYLHCGVREHAMGALANGLAAHGGVVPITVTYLAFADYLRPAMRMAALMNLRVLFVFSHDSIGIGTNGPTHQPVEVLASLRAMPNMLVMRPADAAEALECWQLALAHRGGPVSLVFARQALPNVRQVLSDASSPEDIEAAAGLNWSGRGAYVIAPARDFARQVTLLATGSEVLVALQARERLQAQGVSTAVVSMPCWELFEQQSADYRAEVLCPGSITVAVEAAVRQGWDRYLGERGAFVGMHGFGASGPPEALYRHFGITPEAVASAAMQLLNG